MSTKKEEALDAKPFYYEESGWPFMHYMIATALAEMRIVPIWANYLSIYVWESCECAISEKFGYFKEQRSDSLIGDVVVGATAITTVYFIDSLLGEAVVSRVEATVPYWWRVAALVVLFLVSFQFEKLNKHRHRLRIGSFLYGLLYNIVISLLFFVPAFIAGGDVLVAIAKRTVIWLVISGSQTLWSSVKVRRIPSFMATLSLGTFTLLLVVALYLF